MYIHNSNEVVLLKQTIFPARAIDLTTQLLHPRLRIHSGRGGGKMGKNF